MDKRKFFAWASLIAIAFFFALFVVEFHPFGAPGNTPTSDYVFSHTQNGTGANNAVTSVVFDYRGLDTLGEETILITSVTGVVMIFRRPFHE